MQLKTMQLRLTDAIEGGWKKADGDELIDEG